MAGEHPILFSGPMVRAILAGQKTQTRRILRPDHAATATQWAAGSTDEGPRRLLRHCPYGGPGDRLWVRETFATEVAGCPGGVSYRADHIDPKGDGPANPMTWRPSIFMPRALSRITLEVVSVRAERLQDITDDDIRAEGITADAVAELLPGGGRGRPHLLSMIAPKPRDQWAIGWDAINGKRAPWASNPWVWRIEFKRVEVDRG